MRQQVRYRLMATHGPAGTKPPSRRVRCQLRESTGRLFSKGTGLPDAHALRVIATKQAGAHSLDASTTSSTGSGHHLPAAMRELLPI